MSIRATTLDEFLAARGLQFPISDYMDDKLRIPHGLTQRKWKELHKNASKAADDYSSKRIAAINEYSERLASGEFREKTSTELLIEKAKYGHSDNAATQAARRLCEKRGIDWSNNNEECQQLQNTQELRNMP